MVRDRMNALLFAQALKPLAASLGQFGDVAIDAVAQQVFVKETP